MKRKRLPPEIFKIPVQLIKQGWYSDKYFIRTKEILQKDRNHNRVLMQVFARQAGIICGVDLAIAILKLCADKPQQLKIRALYDGEPIKKNETIMTIEGDYSTFAHLETVYLGILARASAVATAVRRVVEVARGKTVLFFSARFDYFANQELDGYAAYIGGPQGVSTDAGASWWQAQGIGTIPHSLIAAYQGDTVQAALAFDRYMPPEIQRIVLVDFDNDCIGTSLKVAQALGDRLWGVRFDTAENLQDKSVKGRGKNFRGVCPQLVFKARQALDRAGFKKVKII
ncbi:MAG: quinolinate phosphoribosyl transferase, partial [Spirochaetes bacterium]